MTTHIRLDGMMPEKIASVEHGAGILRRWAKIKYTDGSVIIISMGRFGLMLDEKAFSYFSRKNTLLEVPPENIEDVAAYLATMHAIQEDFAPQSIRDPALRVMVNEALEAGSARGFAGRVSGWLENYRNGRKER